MAPAFIESLEDRRLFAFDNWGDAERLIRYPDAQQAFSNTSTPTTGAGQTIAVIDSGIDYTDPVLGGGFGAGYKVVAGHNFVDNNDNVMDTFGHGTEVAGLIAASQFTSGGLTYQGVAPDAHLIALKVDDDGSTLVPDSRIAAALQWVIDNRTTYGIGVVNISYGTGDFPANAVSSVYGSQIQTLTDEGVIIVSSAGNNDAYTGAQTDQGINTPAADPNVISVGSVDTADTISDFSDRGKVLDLLAPGEGVVTTFATQDGVPGDGGYGPVQGTSFASPIVAGTVALMRNIDPTLVEKDALSILLASGVKNFDGDTETGNTTKLNYPRLDVLAALKLTVARTPGSSSEQAIVGKNGNGNAIAVDAEGVTSYVYYDSAARTMKYATRNTLGQWSATQDIDDATPYQGYYVSLAIDPLGQPAVAYFDGTNGDLKFARYDGISWNVQDVDSKNSVGLYPSLAFDRNGLAVITYYRKTTGDLKAAREQLDGSFVLSNIDTHGDVGRSSAVAADANGRLGVAYEDSGHGDVKYGILTTRATAWATTVIDSATKGASFISTAFNPADNAPWVSYYDSSPANLKVAHLDGRKWMPARVASGGTGLFTTMLFADDTPAVLFWNKRQNSLMLTSLQDNSWVTNTLKSDAGRFAAGAIDPTLDIVRYSYYDPADASLDVDGDAVS